jgi:hypothetical protein
MILRMHNMNFFRTVAVVAALLLVSTIGFAQQKKTAKSVAKPNLQAQKSSNAKLNKPTEAKVVSSVPMQRIEDPTLNAAIVTYEKARVGRVISKELLGSYSLVDKNYSKNVVLEGENYVDYNNIFTIEAAKKKGNIKDDYDVKAYSEKQKTANEKLSTAEEKLLQMKQNQEMQIATPPSQVENNIFGNE